MKSKTQIEEIADTIILFESMNKSWCWADIEYWLNIKLTENDKKRIDKALKEC